MLKAAQAAFRAGERVDAQALSTALGISRTSIYRWFGTRDQLMGEMLAWRRARSSSIAVVSSAAPA